MIGIDDMTSPILLLILGIAVGALIGALAHRLFNAESTKNRRLEQQIDQLQRQHLKYQAEVSDHFSKTAELLSRLNSSYRDIFSHLAQGAERLGSESDFRSRLPYGPAGSRSNLSDPLGKGGEDRREIEPPRDYAPKDARSSGTLAEGYGFDAYGAEDSENLPDVSSSASSNSPPAAPVQGQPVSAQSR